MNLLQKRQTNDKNDILEKRFIGLILKEESAELDQTQRSLMSTRGFTTDKFFNARGFEVIGDNKLQYTHPIELRFIDMSTRTNKQGVKSKKQNHPVHNKPLFGMINNILRRIQYEYRDKLKEMLNKEYNINT